MAALPPGPRLGGADRRGPVAGVEAVEDHKTIFVRPRKCYGMIYAYEIVGIRRS